MCVGKCVSSESRRADSLRWDFSWNRNAFEFVPEYFVKSRRVTSFILSAIEYFVALRARD